MATQISKIDNPQDSGRSMQIAVVGCGYVADFYLNNLKSHPDFVVGGAYDAAPNRLAAFCKHYGCTPYSSLEELLADPSVGMVLNLTNPRSHFSVSEAALLAGKHVYTEKPLGMNVADARRLAELAARKNVRLGCAPCSVLSDTAQTLGKAIRDGVVGKIRLVYANFDDGMIAPGMKPWKWKSDTGIPWPAKDEFEVGCCYEHSGYFLTWLAAFFGQARRVTAFASCQIADKGISVDKMAPDFSVGCIEFDEGVVARVTAGLVAPEDKSLMIVGDDGYIVVPHLRNDKGNVLIHRNPGRGHSVADRLCLWGRSNFRKGAARLNLSIGDMGLYERYPRVDLGPFAHAGHGKPVDFFRGPQDMLNCLRMNEPHRLSAELGVHIIEVTEALQYPERFSYQRVIESGFPPIRPLMSSI